MVEAGSLWRKNVTRRTSREPSSNLLGVWEF